MKGLSLFHGVVLQVILKGIGISAHLDVLVRPRGIFYERNREIFFIKPNFVMTNFVNCLPPKRCHCNIEGIDISCLQILWCHVSIM